MARSLTLPFARALPAAASAPTPVSTPVAATLAATLAMTVTAAFARAGAAATTAAFRLRRTAFGFRQERFTRETHLSALVALDELHPHTVALLDHVLGLFRTTMLHL